MELNQEILDRVLTLSHLEIDESKKSELVAQLQGVLDTMEHLNSLNLDDVDPNEWTAGQSTPFREDVAWMPRCHLRQKMRQIGQMVRLEFLKF